MANLKLLNNDCNYEKPLTGFDANGIYFMLDKEHTPHAFKNKVDELVNCGLEREEAEKQVLDMKFELEVYYHPDNGMFCVESEAVESGNIYSPYTGELCDFADE